VIKIGQKTVRFWSKYRSKRLEIEPKQNLLENGIRRSKDGFPCGVDSLRS